MSNDLNKSTLGYTYRKNAKAYVVKDLNSDKEIHLIGTSVNQIKRIQDYMQHPFQWQWKNAKVSPRPIGKNVRWRKF